MRIVRRLDLAFVAEFIPPFLSGWLLFTGVLVFSGVLPSLQYVHHPPVGQVSTWLVWQFPAFAVQAMPIAVVFAALVSMGRMVRHRELFAMQAGGVDPRRPVAVLVVFGLILAAIAVACDQWVVPPASIRLTEIWWPMTSGRQPLHRLAGHTWFVGTGDLSAGRVEGHRMLGVRFVRRSPDGLDLYFAREATFQGDRLRLSNAKHVVLDLASLGSSGTRPKLTDGLVQVSQQAPVMSVRTTGTEAQWVTRYSGGSYEDGRNWLGLWASAHNPLRTSTDRAQDWVTIYRKLADAMANVALLAVAVPLAIRLAGSTVLSFAITLGTSVAWYLAIAGTELAARSGGLPASAVAWLSLAPFVIVGLALNVAAGRT